MALLKYETYITDKCWTATTTKAGQSFIRSQFDYGIRQRRAVRGYDSQSMVIILTSTELTAWKSFWVALNYGADKFNTDQWINQDSTTNKIARYTTPYSVSEIDFDIFEVTAGVELIQTGV